MAPSDDKLKPFFKGVTAICSVFNEDGHNASSTVENIVKSHGGAIAKRISSATHLIWSRGDEHLFNEATKLKKKVVTPEWIEICTAMGQLVSTQSFAPTPSTVPPSPPLLSKTGKPIQQRRRSGKKKTFETEKEALPSPNAECFSSSQMEDPLQQRAASVQIRGPRRSSAAAKKLQAQQKGGGTINEEDEEDEEEEEEEEEGQKEAAPQQLTDASTMTPSHTKDNGHKNNKTPRSASGRKAVSSAAASAAKSTRSSRSSASKKKAAEEEEEEEVVDEVEEMDDDEEWDPELEREREAARGEEEEEDMIISQDDDEDEEEAALSPPADAAAKALLSMSSEKKQKTSKKTTPAPAAVAATSTKATTTSSSSPSSSTAASTTSSKRKRGAPQQLWEPITSVVSKLGTWGCSRCTFENRSRANKCEVCNFDRDGVLPEPREDEEEEEEEEEEETNKKQRRVSRASSASTKAASSSSLSVSKTKKQKQQPEKKKGKVVVAKKGKTTTTKTQKENKNPAKKKEDKSKMCKAKAKATSPAAAAKKKSSGGRKKKQEEEEEEAEVEMEEEVDDEMDMQDEEEEEEEQAGGMILAASGIEKDVRQTLAAEMRGLARTLGTEEGVPPPKMLQTDDPSVPFTHLLVPADGRECRRTLKVLFALCRGSHVITSDWLFDSSSKGQFLNEEDYTIERFQRRTTLAERHVCAGERFFLGPNLEKPPRKLLGRLIQAAGGEVVTSLQQTTLVVLEKGEEGEEWMTTILEKQSGKKTNAGAVHLAKLLEERRVVTPEFLIQGIDSGMLEEERDEYALAVPAAVAAAACAGGGE